MTGLKVGRQRIHVRIGMQTLKDSSFKTTMVQYDLSHLLEYLLAPALSQQILSAVAVSQGQAAVYHSP